MGVLQRGIIFAIGTVANGVLFVFHARVVLRLLAFAEEFAGTGPATDALNLLPTAIQLAIGGLQIGLILYFVGGLGQERAATRRVRP